MYEIFNEIPQPICPMFKTFGFSENAHKTVAVPQYKVHLKVFFHTVKVNVAPLTKRKYRVRPSSMGTTKEGKMR